MDFQSFGYSFPNLAPQGRFCSTEIHGCYSTPRYATILQPFAQSFAAILRKHKDAVVTHGNDGI
jgi:hypothetical protein